MSEKIYFYPVWIRIWHGLNAIFIILLILVRNKHAVFRS